MYQQPNHAELKALLTTYILFNDKISTKLEYFLKIKFNKVLCEYQVPIYEQKDQGIPRTLSKIQMENGVARVCVAYTL